MRWTDYYAIGATVLTLAVVGWWTHLLMLPTPQRGFGAAQGVLVAMAVMGVAVLQGSIACGIALAKHPSPIAWVCAGLHALVILVGVVKSFVG
jgi:hypothetical protein